jgi:hypothetical protein
VKERLLVRTHCAEVLLGCLLIAVPFVGQLVSEARGRYEPLVAALQYEPDAYASAPSDAAETDWLPQVNLATLAFGLAGALVIMIGVGGLVAVWRSAATTREDTDDSRLDHHDLPRRAVVSHAAELEWLERLGANRARPHQPA